jgi:hypothetical protein
MFDEYFSVGTKYICFYHDQDSYACKEMKPSPKVAHNYESILMEIIRTLSKVASLTS